MVTVTSDHHDSIISISIIITITIITITIIMIIIIIAIIHGRQYEED
jgi:hypothetical protein